jgi:two-component system cell cycle sensor histidine kinase/response regulator CckA
MRILVVDDNPTNRKLLRVMLETVGHRTIEASDGVEALERLSSEVIDAVISDVLMPRMDGHRLCYELRRDESLRGIPIVIYSGVYASPADEGLAMRVGADRFVRRPAPAAENLGALGDAVRTRGGSHRAPAVEELDILKEYRDRLVLELERKNLELESASRALKASEERYRDLMEHAQDAIFVYDENGIVEEVNRAAELLVGATREQIVGRSFLVTLPAEDREQVLSDFRETLENGRSLELKQIRIERRDGTIVPAEVTSSVVEIGGKPLVVGHLRDVSERNAMAEQFRVAQKMEAVGLLAGGVAHDFNNLLTAILGYSQLLATELAGNPEHFSAIEEIRKAGERAAGLTGQLLAFSRKQILAPKVLDANEIVRQIREMLARLIGEDIRMVMNLDPALGMIRADAGQLEQVIMNLAVNARDAMPHGGRLTLETANVELDESDTHSHAPAMPGPYVMLVVTDTGMGMDGATRERIFEPFFTTKEKGHGTGLGLSTVYGIVKQSGGFISVETETGKGTAFRVYLPRVNVPADPALVPESATLPAFGTETILLVEDEDSVRTLARKTLEARGYRVLEAANGGEASEIARGESVDLLLTDVVLPGIGGGEIAERIHGLHPRAKVLYTSGYTDELAVRGVPIARDAAFLQKPFTPAILARKVREVLDA